MRTYAHTHIHTYAPKHSIFRQEQIAAQRKLDFELALEREAAILRERMQQQILHVGQEEDNLTLLKQQQEEER